ncbi:hypothetical protein D3C87_1848480 [compost metagenome]
MTPATQASAPPVSQVMRTTLATSMPTTRASAGFWLTARIDRPAWVRVIIRCTAITSSTVSSSRAIWSGVMRMPKPIGMAIWIALEK